MIQNLSDEINLIIQNGASAPGSLDVAFLVVFSQATRNWDFI